MTDETPKWMRWTGLALSVLPCLMLLASATMKFLHKPMIVEQFTGKFGYPESLLPVLGAVELLCTALYLLPPTAVLGAILLTGYLGGAVATHARVHDNFLPPLLLGIVLWLGLFLRDVRLRALLPLRKPI